MGRVKKTVDNIRLKADRKKGIITEDERGKEQLKETHSGRKRGTLLKTDIATVHSPTAGYVTDCDARTTRLIPRSDQSVLQGDRRFPVAG